jgi:hypothetical protein
MLLVGGDARQANDQEGYGAGHQGVALSFHASVAGITYANADGSSRQVVLGRCRKGEGLKLVREPANSYDRNAVGVRRSNGEQLGYLPRELARKVAPLLDGGSLCQAKIVRLESLQYYVACTINVVIFERGKVPFDGEQPDASTSTQRAAGSGDELITCKRCANNGRYYCRVDGPRGIALNKYQAHRLCKYCQAVISYPVCGDR